MLGLWLHNIWHLLNWKFKANAKIFTIQTSNGLSDSTKHATERVSIPTQQNVLHSLVTTWRNTHSTLMMATTHISKIPMNTRTTSQLSADDLIDMIKPCISVLCTWSVIRNVAMTKQYIEKDPTGSFYACWINPHKYFSNTVLLYVESYVQSCQTPDANELTWVLVKGEGGIGFNICLFQHIRSHCDDIEAQNQEEIPFSFWKVPKGISSAPLTTLHNTTQLYSDLVSLCPTAGAVRLRPIF